MKNMDRYLIQNLHYIHLKDKSADVNIRQSHPKLAKIIFNDQGVHTPLIAYHGYDIHDKPIIDSVAFGDDWGAGQD